jgi:hypothetical protein
MNLIITLHKCCNMAQVCGDRKRMIPKYHSFSYYIASSVAAACQLRNYLIRKTLMLSAELVCKGNQFVI